jgi:hypothetical protein
LANPKSVTLRYPRSSSNRFWQRGEGESVHKRRTGNLRFQVAVNNALRMHVRKRQDNACRVEASSLLGNPLGVESVEHGKQLASQHGLQNEIQEVVVLDEER